jgi:hypothetical protein
MWNLQAQHPAAKVAASHKFRRRFLAGEAPDLDGIIGPIKHLDVPSDNMSAGDHS